MDEPGKELELALPGQLAWLAHKGLAVAPGRPELGRPPVTRGVAPAYARGLMDLDPTDAARVRRILRTEIREPKSRYMRPRWLESGEAVPGLLVSLRYTGQDAHGIAARTRELDMAFRRAAATLENYYLREQDTGWAHPMRPERGGLWVVDSRRGSYELLATVYGALVIWATSAPVSLASLVSPAWDSAVATTRVGRWAVGQFYGTPEDGPPQLGSAPGDTEWGVKQTIALEPVMLAAAEAGNGLEFVNNSTTGEVRLTIYPNKELTVEDD